MGGADRDQGQSKRARGQEGTARCFFFFFSLYLCCFSSCPNPLGSGLLGGKAECFEFSSEDQDLIFLITWMCPTDFSHCEVITSFTQVLQSLYYSCYFIFLSTVPKTPFHSTQHCTSTVIEAISCLAADVPRRGMVARLTHLGTESN